MSFVEIPVIGSEYPALVDSDDLSLITGFKWYLNTNGYAATTFHRKGRGRKDKDRNVNLMMHKVILCDYKEAGKVIDHITGIRLDNRKGNLRWVSYSINSVNSRRFSPAHTSKYRGVFYATRDKCWVASCAGKHLGSFPSERIAALVVDKAAKHFYGEFALLNMPYAAYLGAVPHVDFTPAPIGTSQHKGISYYRGSQKRVKRWRAIHLRKTIGYYFTEEEAIIAYENYTRFIR